MLTTPHADLAAAADVLLAAHHAPAPLLLPNAWDVASALAVVAAGFPVVATSSRAVAQVFGEPDDDTADPDSVFAFLARIAGAVEVPVSADTQAGFGVPAEEFVERLLGAGLVGCNLEDGDHHGGGQLVEAERQAAYLAEARAAAERHGVHVVINARVDTFIRGVGDGSAQLTEAIRRGRLYLDAGADCVYPIAVHRSDDVAALVAEIPGPVNILARRGGLSIATLTALGVRRISLASGVFGLLNLRHAEVLAALAAGASLDDI